MANTNATQSTLLLLAGGDELRLTQAPLQALAGGADEVAATQAFALVLASIPSAAIRSTQALLLSLAGVSGEGIRDSQSLLQVLARFVPCLTRWAQCWRIERRDGEVFNFTSHDKAISFRGETYQPCHSLAASAAELGSLLGAPGNVELLGVIADAAITETDLYGGLFDQAEVEIWMLPWQNAGGEIPFRLTAGVAGNLSQGTEGFSLEVLTPGARLQQQPLLETYTPGCRYELGDARCGVDLDALAVVGTVTQVADEDVTSRAQHRVFWDSNRSEDDGYFDMGLLQWTSGENAGQSSEIKRYAGGQFVLWRPALYNIEVGDDYEARPGCDKRSGTCKTKFDNFINFGGFEDVPGKDAILRTPDAK